MAKVIITRYLEKEVNRVFRKGAIEIFGLMKTLENFPKKGKFLAQVGGIAIKELKCKSHRFYFISDAFKVKFLDVSELNDLLIKFVRMSDKKSQQKTIEEIKKILRMLGERGF